MSEVRIASTLWAPGVPAWEDVDVIDPRRHARPTMALRVARAAGRYDAMVLNGNARYDDLLLGAKIVVAALRPAPRGAGLITYVNAMAAGKLVVVSDTCAVREYVEDRRTGLIVPPGDPAALAMTLRWALDPANADEVRGIAERGREEVLAYWPADYWARLKELDVAGVERLREERAA